jgi:ketopantoate reductase
MGAGAVGGYYGAALAGRGHAVTFVARGEHLRALRDRGLTIRSGGRATVLRPVQAVAFPAEADDGFDLVLFTVKGYDTEPAALALRAAVGPDTAVLTLQNGVDSGDRLGALLGEERILIGTTTIATTITEPGVIDQANPLAWDKSTCSIRSCSARPSMDVTEPASSRTVPSSRRPGRCRPGADPPWQPRTVRFMASTVAGRSVKAR